jgi:hypothetical protein
VSELSFIERRKFVRYLTNIRVDYRVIDAAEEARIKADTTSFRSLSDAPKVTASKDVTTVLTEDMSVGGLKIAAEEPFVLGSKMLLELHLQEIPVSVGALAMVVWSKGEKNDEGKYTAGLRFESINQEDLDRIKRYLVLQKRAEIARRNDSG